MGVDSSPSHLAFFILSITITYYISARFQVIPQNNRLNLNLFGYFFWLIKEIIKSSIVVSKIVWSPKIKIDPTMEWVESDLKNDQAIAVFANSITLTPGTVTLDTNKGSLLIHALAPELIEDLKTGEMLGRIKKCAE
jgi:multicomponent Na+:H+ antiporter subunit E